MAKAATKPIEEPTEDPRRVRAREAAERLGDLHRELGRLEVEHNEQVQLERRHREEADSCALEATRGDNRAKADYARHVRLRNAAGETAERLSASLAAIKVEIESADHDLRIANLGASDATIEELKRVCFESAERLDVLLPQLSDAIKHFRACHHELASALGNNSSGMIANAYRLRTALTVSAGIDSVMSGARAIFSDRFKGSLLEWDRHLIGNEVERARRRRAIQAGVPLSDEELDE